MKRLLPPHTVLLFWIFLQTPVVSVQASESDVPTERHFALAEQGTDCGVYLAVLTRTREEVERQRRLEVAQRELLKKRRAELEQCAAARGVASLSGDDGEMLAAQKCPSSYRAWLSPGARLRITREDVSDFEGGIRLAQNHLKKHCPAVLTGSF